MIFNEHHLHGSSKCMHLNVSFKIVIIQHLTDCLILRVFKASISLLKMIYFLKSESRTWSSTEHAHKEQKFD